MKPFDPRDAERFSKLLGLLGSNHDGERSAAALKATEFLQARKLVWSDIGQMLKAPPTLAIPAPSRVVRTHRQDARSCLSSQVSWKPHERKFLTQMASQLRRPSEKQRDWLDGLVDRARKSR